MGPGASITFRSTKSLAYKTNHGSHFYRIQLKFIRIKDDLKFWTCEHYHFMNNKLIQNENKIKELESILWQQPSILWQQPFNPIISTHINRLILQQEKLLIFAQHQRETQGRNK